MTSPRRPHKLHELQRLWLIEATRNKVLPLDDRMSEKIKLDTCGQAEVVRGNTQLLFAGMRLSRELCPQHQEQVPRGNRAGRRTEDGRQRRYRRSGREDRGWSLHPSTTGWRRIATTNIGFLHSSGSHRPGTRGSLKGEHQVRMEFAYDGGGTEKGG